MDQKNKHIKDEKWIEEQKNLFDNLKAPFKNSKEEIWEDVFDERTKNTPVLSINRTKRDVWLRIFIAATITLLIGVTLFMNLYTKTIICNKGDILSHQLPDGSTVTMNAASSLSYNPYWWHFSRNLSFEGEAFFEVSKGNNFSVHSTMCKTQVLGTSFNIYSRENNYKVFCETGKVKVTNKETNKEIILKPNEIVELTSNSTFNKQSSVNPDEVISWKKNKLCFNAVPLSDVFKEIERQYNITIEYDKKNLTGLVYTGYFEKLKSAHSTLNLICLSFELKFVEVYKNKYRVHSK